MQQMEIHSYLKQFFMTTGCEIEKETEDYLTVQLTCEMDKMLMNGQFYWHYIEKTGGIPEPQKITFITNFSTEKNSVKGERIHFGSPRLQQIFHAAKKMGGFIRLYENQPGREGKHTALYPWLCLNLKISYICDRRKDFFRSLSMNLINGMIVDDFHRKLTDKNVPLVPKIPDFAFTFSPLFKPESGIRRIKQFVEQEILRDDHSWATEARKRRKKDMKLLDSFFEHTEEKPERYFVEKEVIFNQYEPKITVSIINGGLFYLSQKFLQMKI